MERGSICCVVCIKEQDQLLNKAVAHQNFLKRASEIHSTLHGLLELHLLIDALGFAL